MTIFLIILGCVLLFYFLSLSGRRNHPGLQALRGWAYAHRGLHGNGAPENSMKAFRRAKKAGYGIELDIHLLKDGNLAVMHDSLLARTTGAQGRIEDLTTQQLPDYKLEGTEETIPTFQEVLDLFAGSAPLIVELKEVGNCADLCEAACRMLDNYKGPYCLESFDPRCVKWLKDHRPDLIRGQLAENYFKTKNSKLPGILKFVLGNLMLNFRTKPDFVAYKYADRKMLSFQLCRKVWGQQTALWTIKSQEDFDIAVKQNALPIFEGFTP